MLENGEITTDEAIKLLKTNREERTMKEEITKVLTMIQEGKIDADKGSELIQVLQQKEESGNKFVEKQSI